VNSRKKKRHKLRFLRFVGNASQFIFDKLEKTFWFVIITTGYLAWLILLTPNLIYPITISIQSPHAEFHSSGRKLSIIELKPKPDQSITNFQNSAEFRLEVPKKGNLGISLLLDKSFTQEESNLLRAGFTYLMNNVPGNKNVEFCSNLYSSFQYHKAGIHPELYNTIVNPVFTSNSELYVRRSTKETSATAFTYKTFLHKTPLDDFALEYNVKYLTSENDFYKSPQFIAGVLLHEMLHNLGYYHEDQGNRGSDDELQKQLRGNVIFEIGECVSRNGNLKTEDVETLHQLINDKLKIKGDLLAKHAQQRVDESIVTKNQNTIIQTVPEISNDEVMRSLQEISQNLPPATRSIPTPNSHLQTNQENEGF
jgi:hypothetical protein